MTRPRPHGGARTPGSYAAAVSTSAPVVAGVGLGCFSVWALVTPVAPPNPSLPLPRLSAGALLLGTPEAAWGQARARRGFGSRHRQVTVRGLSPMRDLAAPKGFESGSR